MLTIIPFLLCCELLSIDPKTLRRWIWQAQMPLLPHPSDARMKCLTQQQVQSLAKQHGRTLKATEAWEETSSSSWQEQKIMGMQAQKEPNSLDAGAGWLKQLADVETQITHLQEQLASLRTLAHSLELSASAASPDVIGNAAASPHSTGVEGASDEECQYSWAPHPAESRHRPVLPLIEYGAAGSYVIICPTLGELVLQPDSGCGLPGWLLSLPSGLWGNEGA
jgi:hypothetical protein